MIPTADRYRKPTMRQTLPRPHVCMDSLKPSTAHKAGSIIPSIYRWGNRASREGQVVVQGHRAEKEQSWDSNPGGLAPEPRLPTFSLAPWSLEIFDLSQPPSAPGDVGTTTQPSPGPGIREGGVVIVLLSAHHMPRMLLGNRHPASLPPLNYLNREPCRSLCWAHRRGSTSPSGGATKEITKR